MKIRIGIADDHQLFLKSLTLLINGFPGFEVTVEALNGQDLLNKLSTSEELPDILLVDVNMPLMDGIKVTEIITKDFPEIKVTALSSKDDDSTIIGMIRAGASAYLVKDIHPDELGKALIEINDKGYYNADASNINYRRLIKKAHEDVLHISSNEKIFLNLACSDLTYKQIANKMFLSERTIDGYRESLFEKLNVQSRVGMVLEGIRRGLVDIN